jgi:hypothetical protein
VRRGPNDGGDHPVDELRGELFRRERDQELDKDGCQADGASWRRITPVRAAGERRELTPRDSMSLDRHQFDSRKPVVLAEKRQSVPALDRYAGSKRVRTHPQNVGVLEQGAPERREISLLPLSLRDFDPDTRRGAMNHKSPAGCVHPRSIGGVAMLIRHKYYPQPTKLL